MKQGKRLTLVIILTFVILFYFGVMIKTSLIAQKVATKEALLILSDKDPQNGKPKVINEWEIACKDLIKKSEELEKQGLNKDEIIAKINPIAAERVAKKLGIEKPSDVQEAVDRYYDALGR